MRISRKFKGFKTSKPKHILGDTTDPTKLPNGQESPVDEFGNPIFNPAPGVGFNFNSTVNTGNTGTTGEEALYPEVSPEQQKVNQQATSRFFEASPPVGFQTEENNTIVKSQRGVGDSNIASLEDTLLDEELAQVEADTDFLQNEVDNFKQNEPTRDPIREAGDSFRNEVFDIETGEIEEDKDSQLFNPHGGVDIPTAAFLFGENVGKGGDTLTAVASGAKLASGLARNIAAGAGNAKRNAFLLDEFKEEERKGQLSEPTALGKEGGEFNIDPKTGEPSLDLSPEELTGDFITGKEGEPSNVELEGGEYLLQPGGTPIKVLGKNHEEGGEDLNLEKGSEVVSQFLKPKAKQRKEMSETFGVKIGVKDTYASIMDKVNKKSGLTDLLEEETKAIAEVKKQKEAAAEKGADESTLNINLEFLSSKINDIGEEKKGLQKAATTAFKQIFELQEASKPKKKMETTEFKIGGKVYSRDNILDIAKEFKVDEDKALSIVEKMQEGGKSGTAKKNVRPGQSKTGKGLFGDVTIEEYKGFIKKNSSWFDFDNFDPSNPEDVAELQKKYNSLTPGNKVKEDGLFGEQTASLSLLEMPEAEIPSINPIETEAPADIELLQKQIIAKSEEEIPNTNLGEDLEIIEDKDGIGSNVLLLPDNTPLLPQGLQMPSKQRRRFGQIEAELLTPDAQITEINRGVDSAMAKISQLPSGQQEAAAIQLQSNAQVQKDKAIQSTEVFNKKALQQEAAVNLRQSDREEEARIIDNLSYERRVFGALSNTEDDFRRFFNTAQERNAQNFNLINSLNLINQNSENFGFGNEGVQHDKGTNIDLNELLANGQFQQAVAISNRAKAKANPKKKRGGRIKRKY